MRAAGSHWRAIAAPIIARVIAEVGLDDARALCRALHDAYPFGERRFWPYKAWRLEVRYQLTKARVRAGAADDLTDLPLFQENP